MSPKFNILYVDDEADNLLAFRSVFRRYFNIFTASGGSEAIELLKEQPVHLVLSDQRMPQMTGVELCENIYNQYPGTKCMIVTGYSEMQPIMQAIEQGKVLKYISKPWKVDELKRLIEGALIPIG